jgi:hypothetical protein
MHYKDDQESAGFEVLTAVVKNSSLIWDIKPCSPLKVNRRFGGPCHLYHEDKPIKKPV